MEGSRVDRIEKLQDALNASDTELQAVWREIEEANEADRPAADWVKPMLENAITLNQELLAEMQKQLKEAFPSDSALCANDE